ncbi:hypothetical protein EJ07DRAFT_176370 [Lizonia empirigonia]|nr:hypothetical protein EJ07DRAFT_176370 [Lizonia empirigonia]
MDSNMDLQSGRTPLSWAAQSGSKAAVQNSSKQALLPEDILIALVARLQGEDRSVRSAAVEALGKQTLLPEDTPKALGASHSQSLQRRWNHLTHTSYHNQGAHSLSEWSKFRIKDRTEASLRELC